MSHKVGNHTQQSVSLRSEGFGQPHTRSPGRNLAVPLGLCTNCLEKSTILPAQVAALITATFSPSFSLSHGTVLLFYCAEVSLTIYTLLQRNHANDSRWVTLVETDLWSLGKSRMPNRKELNWGRGKGNRDKGEDGQPSRFPQSRGDSQDVELLVLKRTAQRKLGWPVTLEDQIIKTVTTNDASVSQMPKLFPFHDQISFRQQPGKEDWMGYHPILFMKKLGLREYSDLPQTK